MNCPICGQPNKCGVQAALKQGAACWCFHEQFPKGLLELVPEESRNKACICKDCLIAYKASV